LLMNTGLGISLDLKLMYAVSLAHGFRMTGQESAAIQFANFSYGIYREIFTSDLFHIGRYDETPPRIVSSLCLLIDLQIQEGDFKKARRIILDAYEVLDSHMDLVHPMVAHRVYSFMAGFSRNKGDLSHWVENANILGIESSTPINRVFLSFYQCSPGLLRSDGNILYPDNLSFPSSRNYADHFELVYFQQMITELMNTEEIVASYAAQHYSDPLIAEYANCCYVVIHGCRSIIYAQSGNANNAYVCANKTFEYANLLKGEIVFQLIPLSLAYALKVLLSLGSFPIFEEGMRYLDVYSNCYPVVRSAIKSLKSSSLQTQNGLPDFSKI